MLSGWLPYSRSIDTSIPSPCLKPDWHLSAGAALALSACLLELGTQHCFCDRTRDWSDTEHKDGWTEGRTDLLRQRQVARLISLLQPNSVSAQDPLLLVHPHGMSGPFRFGPKGLQQTVLPVLSVFLPKGRSRESNWKLQPLALSSSDTSRFLNPRISCSL